MKKLCLTKNKSAFKLFEVMNQKCSNLCFSCDLTRASEILEIVNLVGPFICLLKTHVDIIEDFSLEFIHELKLLAKKHNFLIFEDRKFTDIGNTVKLQYQKGIYKIVEWADFINCNLLAGEGVVLGLIEIMKEYNEKGLIIISDMSSKGSYKSQEYYKLCIDVANKYNNYCMGFVSNSLDSKEMLIFTPGINLSQLNDDLKQCYKSPQNAVSLGSDILIVGRGIYGSKDPRKMAELYQRECWKAYTSKNN